MAEMLSVTLWQQFMRSEDLSDSVAKIRRSPTISNVHTYEWMYMAMEVRLETSRLEAQELILGKNSTRQNCTPEGRNGGPKRPTKEALESLEDQLGQNLEPKVAPS